MLTIFVNVEKKPLKKQFQTSRSFSAEDQSNSVKLVLNKYCGTIFDFTVMTNAKSGMLIEYTETIIGHSVKEKSFNDDEN